MANRNIAPNNQWREQNADAPSFSPVFLVLTGSDVEISATGPAGVFMVADGDDVYIGATVVVEADGSNDVTLGDSTNTELSLITLGDGIEFSDGGVEVARLYDVGDNEVMPASLPKILAANSNGDVIIVG